MSRVVCAGLAVVALLLVAGCGKKGGPNPPGPANEVTFPRTYPSR